MWPKNANLARISRASAFSPHIGIGHITWTISWPAPDLLVRGVSMPVIVQRRRKLLLFACGKHSVPRRTPFRQATKTVRLATGMAFAFTTEYCSDSQRNGVRLQTGIAFIFDRIPHWNLAAA
jgi:hypothetical protein